MTFRRPPPVSTVNRRNCLTEANRTEIQHGVCAEGKCDCVGTNDEGHRGSSLAGNGRRQGGLHGPLARPAAIVTRKPNESSHRVRFSAKTPAYPLEVAV